MDNLRLGIDVTPVIWLKNLSRVPRLSVSSKVDFFVQNQWIVSTRISGLFRPESVDDLDQNTHQNFWISQKTPELSEAWEKNVRPFYISLEKIRRYVKHNVNPFENDFNEKDVENLWCVACSVHEDEEALREINRLIHIWLKRFE